MDFFSVEVITCSGLVRYLVLCVIDLQTRRVKMIAGITPEPNWRWMIQAARNLTDPEGGFLRGSRYVIHDRDPLFTEHFADALAASGVCAVELPAQSPNLNAYAERFVRSIESECLGTIIPIGEHHLRVAVRDFTAHYHLERNHQGLKNERIEKPTGEVRPKGAVRCRDRLGSILKDYYRAAA